MLQSEMKDCTVLSSLFLCPFDFARAVWYSVRFGQISSSFHARVAKFASIVVPSWSRVHLQRVGVWVP
jgi:hypothetical protein